MTITREINGVTHEIELTDGEVFDAYLEKEFEFDKSDIENVLYGMSDDELIEEYGADRAKIESLMDEIATEKRRNMDKYDTDWNYATTEAIRDVLARNVEVAS